MAHYIHFNDNFHQDGLEPKWPAIVVQDGNKKIIECNKVRLKDCEGNLIATVIFSPDQILDSDHYDGIKGWIEVAPGTEIEMD